MGRPFAAFVVGNANYADKSDFPQLPYCKEDALSVFKTLTEQPSGIFDPERSQYHLDLSRDELVKHLSDFFRVLDKEDTVLLYFACHGRHFGRKGLSLVMTDSDHNNLAGTAFNVVHLNDFLVERRIAKSVIIFDCCGAGRALDGMRERGRNGSFNLDEISGRGKWVIASCQEYQNANELEALQHGLFSYFFVEGIRTGAAVGGDNEFIDLPSIFSYAEHKIASGYKEVAQDPVCDGLEVSGGPILVARNPAFKKQFHGAQIITGAILDSFEEPDLADEDRFNVVRQSKLRSFIQNVTLPDGSLSSELAMTVFGELIGLDRRRIELEIEAKNAEERFRGPLRTHAAVSSPYRVESDLLLDRLAHLAPALELGADDLGLSIKERHWGRTMLVSSRREGSGGLVPSVGSIFSHYFIEALYGRGADSSGAVTVASAYDYVSRRIGCLHPLSPSPSLPWRPYGFRFHCNVITLMSV